MLAGGLRRDLFAVALLAGAPLLAASLGTGRTSSVTLHLGPGDSPYVAGLLREYEIVQGATAQWTTPDATVELPLSVSGGPLALVYHYSRPPAEAADATVYFAGTLVDRFTPRMGADQRRVALGALPPTPVVARFQVASQDPRRLGLRLGWVRLEMGAGSRVRLRGPALVRPAALVLLLYLIWRIAGWSAWGAALLSAPWSAAATLGVGLDPWLVHRLLTGLPEWLGVLGLGGVGAAAALRARGRVDGEAVRVVTALAVTAFLVRAAIFNHPDYYYSDLRIHARLVEMVRAAGLDFLRAPADYIVKNKAWSRVIDGRVYAFPYTPAFHTPFALTSLSFDGLITALKLGAAAATVVPIVALWSLSRRWNASVLGVFLLLLVPIYVHHLDLAYQAALFGHAVDMVFVAWLAGRVDRIASPSALLPAAALTAACQLSYVGAVIVLPIFVAALAAFTLLEDRSRPGLRRAVAILTFGAAGSLLAVALYYRHFSPLVVDALSQVASGVPVAAVDDAPRQGFLEVLVRFTQRYFDGLWTPLALWGFVVLLRRGAGRPLIAAWGATYVLLLLGRARLPFVFQHPHDALFVTPLVCLAAGEPITLLFRAGGWKRGLAAVLIAVLALQGIAQQREAWARHIQAWL
jgi:hypothetical protein